MTDLEKFKAWAAEHQTMDGYPQYTPFDAWMESRRAAIEEAAAICDEKQDWYEKDRCNGQAIAVSACGDEIRALTNGENN